MKNVVYKYGIAPGMFPVEMPADAEILSAQMQGNKAVMWARVNPEVALVTRRFIVVGTGHEFQSTTDLHCSYIATFQQDGGALVWHLFELRERQA